jgi:hypothetical protein
VWTASVHVQLSLAMRFTHICAPANTTAAQHQQQHWMDTQLMIGSACLYLHAYDSMHIRCHCLRYLCDSDHIVVTMPLQQHLPAPSHTCNSS